MCVADREEHEAYNSLKSLKIVDINHRKVHLASCKHKIGRVTLTPEIIMWLMVIVDGSDEPIERTMFAR